MHKDFLNFERLQLLNLLAYHPGTCRETSTWGYLQYAKIWSKTSLIQIFDDVIANQEYKRSPCDVAQPSYLKMSGPVIPKRDLK